MRSFVLVEVEHEAPRDLHGFLHMLDDSDYLPDDIVVLGTKVKGPLREFQSCWVPAESLDTVTIYEP